MQLNQIVELYQRLPEIINPIFFSIGSFSVRWYAIMYLIGFGVVYLLLKWRIKRKESDYNADMVIDVLYYSILGIIIGGRLGYVIFYDLQYFLSNPIAIISPFNPSSGEFAGIYGMSYFGGLIGVIFGLYLLIRKEKTSFWKLADFIVPAIPAGYFFGRLGNFINGELYGRATEKAWGMYFSSDTLGILRHPSQLYEAFFEGAVLFIILWLLRNKLKNNPGQLLFIYLFGYGFFRFIIEFFRQPDFQVGFIYGLTLGQILSLMLMVFSATIYFWKKNREVI